MASTTNTIHRTCYRCCSHHLLQRSTRCLLKLLYTTFTTPALHNIYYSALHSVFNSCYPRRQIQLLYTASTIAALTASDLCSCFTQRLLQLLSQHLDLCSCFTQRLLQIPYTAPVTAAPHSIYHRANYIVSPIAVLHIIY